MSYRCVRVFWSAGHMSAPLHQRSKPSVVSYLAERGGGELDKRKENQEGRSCRHDLSKPLCCPLEAGLCAVRKIGPVCDASCVYQMQSFGSCRFRLKKDTNVQMQINLSTCFPAKISIY